MLLSRKYRGINQNFSSHSLVENLFWFWGGEVNLFLCCAATVLPTVTSFPDTTNICLQFISTYTNVIWTLHVVSDHHSFPVQAPPPHKPEPALKLNVKCFYGREKKIKPWLEYMDHMNLCLYWCIRLFIIFLFIKIIIEHNTREWEYRNTRVENIKSEASPLLELFSVYHHLRALPCHLSFLHLWRWFLPL